MNPINKISLAALILCSVTSAGVYAQSGDNVKPADNLIPEMDYNPNWYVTPSLNMLIPDSGFDVGNHGEGAGLTIGKPVSEDFDIQIGTRYGRQRANDLKYQQNMLGIDGLYFFTRGAIRPFIFVGAGYQEDRLNGNGGQASAYAPYVNAGLGAQVVITDRWSLQADFRREHGYLRDNEFNNRHNSNNYLQVGVSYAFGDTPTRPRVVAVTPPPAPAPVMVAAPIVVAPVAPPPPRFEKIVLSSTELFSFDNYRLQMPQQKLDDIAVALNNNPQVNHVVISGYTDRIGSDKYNQKLSEQRAGAVKDYLISKNVASDRLQIQGKGKADPLVMCTEKNLKKLIVCLEPNRRVEVEQINIEQRIPAGK